MSLTTQAAWEEAARALGAGQGSLVALWGEADRVHMVLLGEGRQAGPGAEGAALRHLTLPCPQRRYPAVSRHHSPALRLERAIADLHGLTPDGLPDPRPWLDHGRPYDFLPVEGEHLHVVPVGPVHAGIIEPGHFRFTLCGETVVRLEARLGYAHRGVEALFHGASLAQGARLAGRISGDSTVGYAIAFAQAAEAALGQPAPPRALFLRGLMAEWERIANHLGDIGAICNDAAFPIMLAHCATLRERMLRAAEGAFGHRLMMDAVIPGGVSHDPDAAALAGLLATARECEARFRPLVALYEKTASLLDRTIGTGILTPALAAGFGAGGYVGRASGRSFDARRDRPYPPYDRLSFTVPVLQQGDVHARLWLRVLEIAQSFRLIEQIAAHLPEGPAHRPLPEMPGAGEGEGSALVEGFRGDIFLWLRLGRDGRIARCHARDPSWFQWPLLESAILGNILADFPLCNKSFNCSYAGVDL
ncbi:hydrogenase large subunit [Acidisoma sp. C75]